MAVEKMRGSLKKLLAALRGEAGILNALIGEHEEVLTLMRRVSAKHGTKNAGDMRRDLYPAIRRALVLHAHAEQAVLYPACREERLLRPLVEHAWDEHAEIERALRELDHLAIDASQWGRRFEVLEGKVERHVHEEEETLFPKALEVFSSDALRDLDERYHLVKERLANSVEQLLYPTIGQGPAPGQGRAL